MPPWGREREPTPHALTWLGIQPTRIEEFRGEVDVNVTEKEKDVASLPGAGSDIESLSSGKLSTQLDEGKVPEVGSSKGEDQTVTHVPRLPRPMNPLANTWPRSIHILPGFLCNPEATKMTQEVILGQNDLFIKNSLVFKVSRTNN